MTHQASLAALILLIGCPAVAHAQKTSVNSAPGATFEVGGVPAWVKSVTAPVDAPVPQETAGSYYALIDRQVNVERSAWYWHEVRKITSQNGVQSGQSVSITFDPAFEKLTLHAIRLIRDGEVLDRLDRSQVKFAPTEQDPQRRFYDESYTAQIPMLGVQVGDMIEVAYTIEGAHPLRRGLFSQVSPMQWSFPVGLHSFRLIYPSRRNLSVRLRNDTTEPRSSEEHGVTEWLYQAENVAGLKIEEDAPEDYNPKRQLHISEFSSWAQVAEWALPLFEPKVSGTPEFEEKVRELNGIADPEQRVVAALRFLQGEVRFVNASFESGLRPPTPLEEVLRRRFGDTKDETMLLVELLRRTGIDAAPALVSYFNRSHVRDFLPSPSVFDHTIAQVRLGPHTYWIDPMRGLQRGPLAQIYVANYGVALVLRPDTQDLTTFRAPSTSWQSKKVVQNFRIWKPGVDAELDVISDFHGLAADRIRSSFQESTREEIQKRYLEFYARQFPDIKVAKDVWFEELPGANACRVTESYVVPNIWQLSEENDRYRIIFRPDDIYSALGSTISPQRRDPYSLNHPNTVVQEIKIQMFEDWPFQAQPSEIATEFFKVRDEPKARGAFLQFNYAFESLKDRLEPGEIVRFNEAVEKAKDTLAYRLTYQTPEQYAKTQRQTLNWAVVAAAFSFFVAAGYIAYRYFRDSRLAAPAALPEGVRPELSGIRGWLILLAIGQIVRPIGFIRSIADLWPTMFYTNSWRQLTDPIEATYNPWWAPTLLYELFVAIAGVAFCVLLIALFFRKRAAWPRCFALFLLANLVAGIIDKLLLHQLPDLTETVTASVRGLVPVATAAAIWIPYVYRSKRVRATFRN